MPYTFGVWKSEYSKDIGCDEIQEMFNSAWKDKIPASHVISQYVESLSAKFPNSETVGQEDCVWSYDPQDIDSTRGNYLYVGIRLSVEDDILDHVFDTATKMASGFGLNIVDWQTQEIWWSDQK
jgi:hypothetical protein